MLKVGELGVNLYQPKSIRIETKNFQGNDDGANGAPYSGTELKIVEEKPNGEQKVWANYLLSGSNNVEFQNLVKNLAEVYAKDAYKHQDNDSKKSATPVIDSTYV